MRMLLATILMKVTVFLSAMNMRMTMLLNDPKRVGERHSRQQGRGQADSIVRMKLHLGKQIGQGDAEEYARGKCQRPANGRAGVLPELADPKDKQDCPVGAHQRIGEIDRLP